MENLSVGFRRYQGFLRQEVTECVHNISLAVQRRQILGLLGASGAGKSLIAHAILGILPPNAVTSGSLKFEGALIDESSRRFLRGKRIALIPQSISHLDPLAKVGRQIRWAARRSGKADLTNQQIEEGLDRFGLPPEVARMLPSQLSGGMARRVMLTMASISDADLIIADEPTNGLDPDNSQKVFQYLRAFAQLGKGVIVITHDLAAIITIADGIAIMKDGHLISREKAADFIHDGAGLASSYAQALWKALPQNSFAPETLTYA